PWCAGRAGDGVNGGNSMPVSSPVKHPPPAFPSDLRCACRHRAGQMKCEAVCGHCNAFASLLANELQSQAKGPKMIAFEVYVNGQKVCTAAHPDQGTLHAQVTRYKLTAKRSPDTDAADQVLT